MSVYFLKRALENHPLKGENWRDFSVFSTISTKQILRGMITGQLIVFHLKKKKNLHFMKPEI
jgi:hypothetical protein